MISVPGGSIFLSVLYTTYSTAVQISADFRFIEPIKMGDGLRLFYSHCPDCKTLLLTYDQFRSGLIHHVSPCLRICLEPYLPYSPTLAVPRKYAHQAPKKEPVAPCHPSWWKVKACAWGFLKIGDPQNHGFQCQNDLTWDDLGVPQVGNFH